MKPSKAVLRVAAQRIADSVDRVAYFPSYEIITNCYHPGTYFDSNRRSVTDAGVQHVMRVFVRHFCEAAPKPEQSSAVSRRDPAAFARELEQLSEITCDEELLDASARVR